MADERYVGPVENVTPTPMSASDLADVLGVGGDKSSAVVEPAIEDTGGTKYYLWAQMPKDVVMEEGGRVTSRTFHQPGIEVKQEMLGLSDEDWNYHLKTKVIRKRPYPQTKLYEAPKRALIREAAQAMEAALAGGE